MLLTYSYDQHSMTDHHHLMQIMIANTFKIQEMGQRLYGFQLLKSHLKLRLK